VRIHSQEHNPSPGRNINFFVGFYNTSGFRLLGIFSLKSDAVALKVRDDYIGWTTNQRSRYREHLVNMSVCCPTQPFGTNFLGGKLISLIANEGLKSWKDKYHIDILAMTTTSLHGSFSQYSGMKWWKNISKTNGTMIIKPLRQELSFWRNWYKTNFPNEYDYCSSSTSPTQTLLTLIFRVLNISKKEFLHEHRRGVFIRSISPNYREFFTEQDETSTEVSEEDWRGWWYKKAMLRRSKREDEKTMDNSKLFHSYIDPRELNLYISI